MIVEINEIRRESMKWTRKGAIGFCGAWGEIFDLPLPPRISLDRREELYNRSISILLRYYDLADALRQPGRPKGRRLGQRQGGRVATPILSLLQSSCS